jgi:4-hydroxy-tetrahydrodipicolinate synthase
MIEPEKLTGIIVPIVTPVTAEGMVDFDGLRRVVRHVIDGGVAGIFALGGTGNFCSFTSEERFEVARAVVTEAGGRVPVLVGCMDSHTRLVMRNVRIAAEAGADVAVVEPPFYYPCTEQDVVAHFRAVAGASPIPIVIYNIPDANKVPIPIPLAIKLSAIPGIIGMKDSTMDFAYFEELVAEFPDGKFRLIQGQEKLAGPSFLLGAHAGILAIGNVVPNLCARLFAAGAAGKLEETRRLQAQLLLAFSLCGLPEGTAAGGDYYNVNVSSFFTGLHCALKLLGICEGVLTVPYAAPSQADFDRVRSILVQQGSLKE